MLPWGLGRSQGGLCSVGCSVHSGCAVRKRDNLCLAHCEGLLGTVLSGWHCRSRCHHVHHTQCHLQSLVTVSGHNPPPELLGVHGEHGCKVEVWGWIDGLGVSSHPVVPGWNLSCSSVPQA